MKKIIFYFLIIAINYLFIELISYGLYSFKFGSYSQIKLQNERLNIIKSIESGPVFTGEKAEVATEKRKWREILHPYFGYSNQAMELKKNCDETVKSDACYERQKMPDDLPVPKKQNGVLNVAVLGGSVAVGTVKGTPHQLYERLLSNLPEYEGYKVNLHLMAAGGYKQPQPLMMLGYYYSLGAQYDIVIALDGFNEIGVSMSEYKWKKIHPVFPRSWNSRVSNTVDQDLVRLTATKYQLNSSHLTRSKVINKKPFKFSITANLLWKALDNNFKNKVSLLNQKIANFSGSDSISKSMQYEKLGPDYQFENWPSLARYSSEIWANATMATYGLATSMGAEFFSFIQPNQYIDNAKPMMSDVEKKVAFIRNPSGSYGGYGAWYRIGYPFLIDYQKTLKNKGVNTTDLTFLFKNESKVVYVDNCCHFNEYGYSKIVEAIVGIIHKSNLKNTETVND